MVEQPFELRGDRTPGELAGRGASGLKRALTVASGAVGAATVAAFSSHLAMSTLWSLSPSVTEAIAFIASVVALVAMLAYEFVIVPGKNS